MYVEVTFRGYISLSRHTDCEGDNDKNLTNQARHFVQCGSVLRCETVVDDGEEEEEEESDATQNLLENLPEILKVLEVFPSNSLSSSQSFYFYTTGNDGAPLCKITSIPNFTILPSTVIEYKNETSVPLQFLTSPSLISPQITTTISSLPSQSTVTCTNIFRPASANVTFFQSTKCGGWLFDDHHIVSQLASPFSPSLSPSSSPYASFDDSHSDLTTTSLQPADGPSPRETRFFRVVYPLGLVLISTPLSQIGSILAAASTLPQPPIVPQLDELEESRNPLDFDDIKAALSKKNMKKIAKAMLTPFVTNVASVDEDEEAEKRQIFPQNYIFAVAAVIQLEHSVLYQIAGGEGYIESPNCEAPRCEELFFELNSP